MNEYGIAKKDAYVFMPPYEWYNNQISEWCEEMGVFLVNYTAGTRSNADYTTPDMDNYVSSDEILRSIFEYEKKSSNGMNGFILLIHIGTSPKRDDKLYHHLDGIIEKLLGRGYSFETLIKGLEE
jgi:peptidoglycan/xylan/chitin deacetylase (PgdA/CDA1 family)